MSYSEYDASRKAINLANELNTLSPSMAMYINHSFDPANIQYMQDAMPIPYPTTNNTRKVTFAKNDMKNLKELEDKPEKSVNLHQECLRKN